MKRTIQVNDIHEITKKHRNIVVIIKTRSSRSYSIILAYFYRRSTTCVVRKVMFVGVVSQYVQPPDFHHRTLGISDSIPKIVKQKLYNFQSTPDLQHQSRFHLKAQIIFSAKVLQSSAFVFIFETSKLNSRHSNYHMHANQ